MSSKVQTIARAGGFALAPVFVIWALWLRFVGGFDLSVHGHVLITSHDPWRPLVGAALSIALFVAAKGRWSHLESWLTVVSRLDDRVVAIAIALALSVVGIVYATTICGGADSYGYVSEADLLLTHELKVPQPWAEQAPWPSARWSFTPLGYRPGLTDADAWSLVPFYAPGLPLLMAGAKLVGGQAGLFWVVPIFGGLMVVATAGIGRRLGASRAGIVGAVLTATSPAVLFMLVSPMTDVAVGGAWLVAFYFMLGESGSSALAAGLFSGLAVLIRPNLAFECGVLGLWYLLRAWRSGQWRREIARASLFTFGAAPGFAALAILNTYWYGSPLSTGYGPLSGYFDVSRFSANAKHYASWFAYAHTPIAYLGVVPFLLPLRWFWPGVKDRLVFVIVGAFVSLLLLEFLIYLEFDAWWYLRFLIPCLPFVFIGFGAAVSALARLGKPIVTLAAMIAVAALCVHDFRVAVREDAFDLWRGDLRYVAMARLVRKLTDDRSVIYSMQHSGSLRYYGGRLTVRYDIIDNDWLDRSVTWFESRGVHPYLVIDEWEIEPLRKLFAGTQALAILDTPPLISYSGGGHVLMYDLASARNPAPTTFDVIETYADRMRSATPAPTERWPLQR